MREQENITEYSERLKSIERMVKELKDARRISIPDALGKLNLIQVDAAAMKDLILNGE